MLLYLFLGLLLLAAVVGLMAAFTRAEPEALARGLRWAGFLFAAAGLVLLPFAGRLSLIAFGPALLIPMLGYMLAGRRGDGRRTASRSGQTSSVETAWLAVTLDHDSGRMDGTVRQGRFSGRPLSALDLGELLALRAECEAADPESVALVEAFLDRVHGAAWRAAAAGQAPPGARPAPGGMTRAEAYEILGLEPGAGPEAVKEAHRRLMQKLHPDHGGSTYLAARINQAKDLLIGN